MAETSSTGTDWRPRQVLPGNKGLRHAATEILSAATAGFAGIQTDQTNAPAADDLAQGRESNRCSPPSWFSKMRYPQSVCSLYSHGR